MFGSLKVNVIVLTNSNQSRNRKQVLSCILYVTTGFKRFRSGSDAKLFMSRTQFEFGLTQINKSTPVDSDAELN